MKNCNLQRLLYEESRSFAYGAGGSLFFQGYKPCFTFHGDVKVSTGS